MKTIKCLMLGIGLFSLCQLTQALAIVGYVNVKMYPGENLIANQLDNGNGNFLSTIFPNTIPDGTTFKRWNAGLNNYDPISSYNSGLGTWSINYAFDTFTSGRGAVLTVPSGGGWTNTFVGSLVSYTNLSPDFGGPIWQPNWANGLHLLGCPMPIGGTVGDMFSRITGRNPLNGESVMTLDEATQTYITSTYNSGTTSWSNPGVFINPGEAVWFNLGPVIVPEPSSAALLFLGVPTVLLHRRNRA